jgi:hypothetical protein
MNTRLMTAVALLAMASVLGGCAAVDAGGRMVSGVGNWMSDYGAKNDNGLAKAGGNLYQNIGTGIQNVAKKPATPAAAANAPASNRTGTDRVEGK